MRLWMAMVEGSRSEGGQKDDLLLQRPAKYRPHRPHRYECSDLQVFCVVGVVLFYRPQAHPIDRRRKY
jgi:hypothetical protein